MDSLKRIPLRQLRLSTLNVRQTGLEEDIPALAEDIRSKGVLENLIGVAGERNTVEIVAGGRRLRALELLAAEKAIPRNHLVPVLIVPIGEAREISLSENIHRIALNPADEYEGFARIVDEHRNDPDPIALCARRQGVTRHRVEQALRLAHLAPPILDALRACGISIDAAKAYASFHDQTLQLVVFQSEERRQFTKHNPREIRDQLKRRTYPAAIAQAVYVGLDAYHAAGGRSERELFMGVEEGDRLIDPSLLDQLARDKAAAELPALAKRDGFAEAMLTPGFSALPPMPRVPAGFSQGAPWTSIDDLAAKDRALAIGVYTLAPAGEGLVLAGWFRRVVADPPQPVLAGPSSAAGSREPPALRVVQAADAPGGNDVRPLPGQMEELVRYRELMLTASHIALERIIGGLLEGASWPVSQGWIPAITPAEDDPETMIVAVLFRVSREDLEAAMPEAEQQLAADARELLPA